VKSDSGFLDGHKVFIVAVIYINRVHIEVFKQYAIGTVEW
jgi:hypothetical protein